jgi:hypothetical protein
MKVTPRDLKDKLELSTFQSHKLTYHTFNGMLLEVEDAHFNHDSAVMLPDRAAEEGGSSPASAHVSGLAVLKSVYAHAKKYPSQKLLILGHTDTSGAASYNVTLSQKRADSILAALTGDRDAWVKIALDKNKVEDYQLILKWANDFQGYGCDPGPITNSDNAETKEAVTQFQKCYNEDFSKSIPEDGKVTKPTWEAFFDVYMDALKALMDTDDAGLGSARSALKFVDGNKKSAGCGESFPAIDKDNVKSVTDRRVEILFFDPGEEPKLDCHPAHAQCVKQKCEIYHNVLYDFKRIDPVPVALPLTRIRFEPGEIDRIFPKVAKKEPADSGIRQRLQAVGFLYAPLNLPAADLTQNVKDAWEHFKKVTGKNDDASAADELSTMVKNVIVDKGKIPAPGEFTMIRYPGTYCVRVGDRFADESDVWTNNPSLGLIPVLAKVEIFRRSKWKGAGKSLKVHFQLSPPDDPPDGSPTKAPALRTAHISSTNNNEAVPPVPPQVVFNMTGSPDKYVKDEKARNPGKNTDPQRYNAHKTVGGKRENTVVGSDRLANVLETTTTRVGFNDELKLSPAAASSHKDAVVVETNEKGEACVLLMPARTGGDRYKLKAFLDPVREKASNGTENFAVMKETGTFVVMRILRISNYLRWDYPSKAEPQFSNCGQDLEDFDITGLLTTEYKKAWLDVIIEAGADKPRTLTQAEWQTAIRRAKSIVQPAGQAHLAPAGLNQVYNVNVLIPDVDPAGAAGVNNPSPGIINFLTAAQYNAAAKGPPPSGLPAWPPAPNPAGGDAAASNYWADMATIRFAIQGEIIKFFSHNAIAGMTVIQAPAMSSFEAEAVIPRSAPNHYNSGWGGGVDRGCYVVFGKTVYGNSTFPYSSTHNCIHETGHVSYFPHQYTTTTEVNVSTGGQYDQHDYHDLCIMGYMKSAKDFCGRCVLRLAGYNPAAFPANNPGP